MNQDEVVLVTKKDGDWWTGKIGDRSGIFPSNYVQYLDPQVKLKCAIKIIKNFTIHYTVYILKLKCLCNKNHIISNICYLLKKYI